MSLPTDDNEPVGREALPTPQQFGRYRVSSQLASGGMGTVYLARAEGPGGYQKLVALKRIHPHLASDERFVSMFLDEARIAAQIQHPNVCSVIDFGEVDGCSYLTMPFIFGEPLHHVFRAVAGASPEVRAQLPWMVCRLVADACEGLHAAHQLRDDRGRLLEVVHRDVSPQNLMVGYDGSLRVLDFGVASARHRHYQTNTGEIKGKFAYLAPEQIEGEATDRRADVWSLGVVLWEGICGTRLFHHESMAATVRAVTDRPIPSLRDHFPEAPLGLEEVVGKALARDRERRYPDARALGRDLLAVLAEEQRFVGPADVAEWMELLFPQGRAAKEELVSDEDVLSLSDVSGVTKRTDQSPADVHPVPQIPGPPPETPPPPARAATQAPAPVASEATADRPAGRHGFLSRPLSLGLALLVVGSLVGGSVAAWMALDRSEAALTFASEAAAPGRAPSLPLSSSDPGPSAPGDALRPRESEPTSPPPAQRPQADLRSDEPARSRVEDSSEPTPAPLPVQPRPTPARPAPARPAPARPVQPAPAQPAPRGQGIVAIGTPGGWAIITHGRERVLGEAPGRFVLPAGPQTIGVQPFGRGPIQQRRVVVQADGVVRLSVPLR